MERRTYLLAASLVVPLMGILLGRLLATQQLHRKAKRLAASTNSAPSRTYHETQLDGWPAPVQRYFRLVLRDGQSYLRGLHLRHTGQFKTSLEGDWLPIIGEEYLVADPPGFIWQGSTKWFTARDEYQHGQGQLTVRLLGAVPIVRKAGPHYDEGELLRWLGESAWLPTNLLPSECVHWAAANDHTARLTLTDHGHEVSYLVSFNEVGELVECTAQHYQGEAGLLPWVGRFADYATRQGMRVPTSIEASWVVEGKRQPYAQFCVDEMTYS